MVSNEIVEYVKTQLNAGFSEDDIRAALRGQGWPEDDINEAFNVIRGFVPPPKAPEEEKVKKATSGFVLSFLGGMLILINGILAGLLPSLLSDIISRVDIVKNISGDFFVNFLGIADILWVIGIVLGVIIIILSMLIYEPGKEKIGSIVLILSLISLVSISGLFIGSILGIIGGILGMAKK